MTRDSLLDQVEQDKVDFIHLQFTDIPGEVKSVSIPAARLAAALEDGVWFDGSSVEGMARVAESDLYLRPDLRSYTIVPWEPLPTGRLLCDLSLPDGTPFIADPRSALKAVVEEARGLGFDYRVSAEVEFFVFQNPGFDARGGPALKPLDSGGYFEVPADRAAKLCYAVAQALHQMGFEVETTHHEVAPGQHEIDLAELDAVRAADAIITLKAGLRALGRKEGLLVSFMPKPIQGVPGSGLHLHQVLLDCRSGGNAFHDPAAQYQLSETGGQFIAGQLAHARGMCAVIAPLVNSYKRLTGAGEAPARISWARLSRGALIRVPEPAPRSGTRIELRAPDPSFNPYLGLAAMLKAGLDGIVTGARLPAPVETAPDGSEATLQEELADPLPETLFEALEELEWDQVVRAALSQPIFERFVTAKAQEWTAYRQHISLWELQNYLEHS